MFWSIWQKTHISKDLNNLKTDALQRKIIVQKLYNEIYKPKDKIILYTKSNKSYYGFGYWMLPFQSPFSHMLPVLLDKEYYPLGNNYPDSFFDSKFLSSSGLVSQGYFEDKGKGIGYFLEEIPLIKTLEKYNFSPEIVYAFEYDGNNFNLSNLTVEMRTKLEKILKKRESYKNWKRYGDKKNMLSFQVAPEWHVILNNNKYELLSNNIAFGSIEVIKNANQDVFSAFIENKIEHGKKVGSDFSTSYIFPDMDIPHAKYSPHFKENIFYLVAGNNLMFYRFTVNDASKMNEVLQTLEFADQENEDISL